MTRKLLGGITSTALESSARVPCATWRESRQGKAVQHFTTGTDVFKKEGGAMLWNFLFALAWLHTGFGFVISPFNFNGQQKQMSTALRAIDSTKFQSAPSSSWSALSSASLLQTTDGKSVVPTSFWSREEVAVVVLFRSYG